MYKAIIFDFDGTLTNGKLFDYRVLNDFLRPYFPDLDGVEYEAVVQQFNMSDIYATGPANFRWRCHSFIKRYGLDEKIADDLEKFWESEAYKYTELRYNAMDVLLRLSKKYKLGILTNGGTQRQHNKLKKAAIYDMMAGIAVSEEVGAPKPDRRMYETVCQRMGVELKDCVFVGDSYAGDILGAYRCGMYPIWFVNNADIPGGSIISRISDLEEIFAILEEIDK